MKKSRIKTGLHPGAIVYTGSRTGENVPIHYIQYDSETIIEKEFSSQTNIQFVPSPDEKVDWYDVRGIHDTNLIQQIGTIYKIHPLALEDIPEVHQRPNFEEFERGIFIVMKALHFDQEKLEFSTEQVAIYFRTGLVFTFQEHESDLFIALRQRLQAAKGRVRTRGADYLAYAIMDVIVDNYFVLLDEVEVHIENLEERIVKDISEIKKTEIHHLKTELLHMRKSIAPLREAVSRFSKSDSHFIKDSTEAYVRDLHDHTIQVLDMVESFRDTLNGLHDLFLSEVSLKMNQVMQVLTLVATIFIPLTFLAGIYGMNFEYIPELKWKYGYFYFWTAMILVGGGLVVFFKKKNWI